MARIPLSDPRPSAIIDGGKKWIGPTWTQIDEDMVLRVTPGKTEDTSKARVVFDLKAYPMVVEDLYKALQIDAQWSTTEPRGFDWWAYRLLPFLG